MVVMMSNWSYPPAFVITRHRQRDPLPSFDDVLYGRPQRRHVALRDFHNEQQLAAAVHATDASWFV
jgi:hypothetical protein